MSAPPGRRERKKQQTRQAISDVATTLFMSRGFDAVTVAEIAAAADVAVQTVFNHFRTKEDLFFDDLRWVTGPADAVRAAPDRQAVAVLEEDYRAAVRQLQEKSYLRGAGVYAATIEASAALRARRADMAGRMQDTLADALGGGEPGWRDHLLAARYAATRRTLDDELVRLVDAGQPVAALDAVITAAFATLAA